MRRPIRLVRNIDAARLFDTFLITSVATVLITRLYLELTGFPQIGSSGLHIAHLLPGGLLMLAAILVMLGSINRSSREASSILGGIGFGLFVDELGKFITRDNDYFFRPSIAIIYVLFMALYLLTRYVIRRSYHPEDYLANAIDLAMEGAIGELDPREYDRARALLNQASPSHPMYEPTRLLLEHAKPSKDYRPLPIDRFLTIVHRPFHWVITRPWYRPLLITLFSIYGTALLVTSIILALTGNAQPLSHLLANPSATTNIIAASSSALSALFIIWGLVHVYRRQAHVALRRFETAVLINIFVTQIFLFVRYQLTAIVALGLAFFVLLSIRLLLNEPDTL